jgi:branched-subunit amino acid ABC-type transport system permease component
MRPKCLVLGSRFWNDLSFAALLFIVASGFILIFALLRVVNPAHGALYLMGGYIGMTAAVASGSFAVGAVAAAVAFSIVYTGLPAELTANQELMHRHLGV